MSTLASRAFPNQATATLATLRETVGRFFGYQQGTAISGTVGGLTTVDNGDDANLWAGAYLRIAEADGVAPEGEWARILSYASGTFTCRAACFSATVEAGDTYEVYSRVTPDEIDKAINETLDGQPTIVSITLTPNATSYDLVADGLVDRRQVLNVWRLDPRFTTSQYAVKLRDWDVQQGENGLLLWIRQPLLISDLVWIEYAMGPGGMEGNASQTTMPVKLVRAAAVCRLLENLLSRQDEAGMQRLGTLLRDMRQQLAQESALYFAPSSKARTTNWQPRPAGNWSSIFLDE